MADKPHSKRSLDIVSTRQGARSKRRPDVDFGITLKDLTSYFMPLYTYSWKGYGHNNATFHTMKQMTLVNEYAVNASSQAPLQERGGDCILLSCLPGRQVYAEFNALPLMDLYQTLTAYHPNTTLNRGTYDGYARGFLSLAERAFAHNNMWPSTNSALTSNVYGQQLPDAAPVNNLFQELLLKTSILPNSTVDTEIMTMTKLLDPEFCYEGGSQTHKFTNVTSLPVYIEVREFMPRVKLTDTLIDDKFGTSTRGYATQAPGIHQTLFADLKRQKNKLLGTTDAHFPNDAYDLFDQKDDKKFKYNKYCKLTNERFVVGDPVYHRIDPGHTWTYKMILPAFRVKMSELMEFVQVKVETWPVVTNQPTDNQQVKFMQGITSDDNSNDNYNIGYVNYSPKFSKFISVRATGSTAYTQGAPGSSTSVITQVDTMAEDSYSQNKLMNETTFDATNNVYVGAYGNRVNPAAQLGLRSATHAVGLLHQVSENHAIRVKPVMPKAHRDEYSFLPNAAGRTEIQLGDEMGQLDPADNEGQTVAMDN